MGEIHKLSLENEGRSRGVFNRIRTTVTQVLRIFHSPLAQQEHESLPSHDRLSDGRSARSLALGLLKRTREIGEKQDAAGVVRVGNMWDHVEARHRIAQQEMLVGLDPIDYLKVLDAQDELLDKATLERQGPLEALRTAQMRERRRAFRRRSNYKTILLAEDATDLESAAQAWLGQHSKHDGQ